MRNCQNVSIKFTLALLTTLFYGKYRINIHEMQYKWHQAVTVWRLNNSRHRNKKHAFEWRSERFVEAVQINADLRIIATRWTPQSNRYWQESVTRLLRIAEILYHLPCQVKLMFKGLISFEITRLHSKQTDPKLSTRKKPGRLMLVWTALEDSGRSLLPRSPRLPKIERIKNQRTCATIWRTYRP